MGLDEGRGEELFTRDQLEMIFSRRKQEHRQLLEEAKDAVIGALKPQLEGMRRDIQTSNHLKAEFGEQLRTLTTEVRQTNTKLDIHIGRRAHDREEQLLVDLGVDTLSLEEKKAFPDVLRSAVDADKTVAHRAIWIPLATNIASAIAGSIVAVAAVLALIANGTIQLGVSHHP